MELKKRARPMRVVMVDALVGNDYSLCLCSGLKAAGVDVSLVVTEDRSENTRVPLNFPLLKWSPSKEAGRSKLAKAAKYARFLARLWAHLRKTRPDAVHFQFFRREWAESLFFAALRLLRLNLVYTAHDVLPPEKKKLDTLIKRLVYTSAKVIIVHSDYLKRMLVKRFGVPAGKISIVPHGNFDNYLPEQPVGRAAARQALDLPQEAHVMLFFGIIREYKGLDLLLQAFEQATRDNPHLHLVIAGSALNEALKEKYARQIAGMAARERVLYHAEFIPNERVALYFEATDAVLLPYRNIYHSGVLHLAYSFARPIIATRVGDFPEAIEPGKSGLLVQTIDAAALQRAIQEAFRDPEALAEMGRYARRLSETQYSWDNVARLTRQVYASRAPRFRHAVAPEFFAAAAERG